MHDVYAMIESSVFGFTHEAWMDYARARAQGFEADVFEYAEVMLQEDPDDSDPVPDDVRDVDGWTPTDWDDHLADLADQGDMGRYLDLAELEGELGARGLAA